MFSDYSRYNNESKTVVHKIFFANTEHNWQSMYSKDLRLGAVFVNRTLKNSRAKQYVHLGYFINGVAGPWRVGMSGGRLQILVGISWRP